MAKRRNRPPVPGHAAQVRQAKKAQRVQRQINQRLREAGRRPGHGTGTDAADIWNPDAHQSEARSIDDPRRGKVSCHACGQLVDLVEINNKWQSRNEDGLPHALTCGLEDPEPS